MEVWCTDNMVSLFVVKGNLTQLFYLLFLVYLDMPLRRFVPMHPSDPLSNKHDIIFVFGANLKLLSEGVDDLSGESLVSNKESVTYVYGHHSFDGLAVGLGTCTRVQ